MSKAEKVSEPSMDEILASIRKIIAEEPSGTKPAAPPQVTRPVMAQAGATAPSPQRASSLAVNPAPAAGPVFGTRVSASSKAVPASAPAAPSAPVAPRVQQEEQNAVSNSLLDEDLADLVESSPSTSQPAPAASAGRAAPSPSVPGSQFGRGSNMAAAGNPSEKVGWRFPRPAAKVEASPQAAAAVSSSPAPVAAAAPPAARVSHPFPAAPAVAGDMAPAASKEAGAKSPSPKGSVAVEARTAVAAPSAAAPAALPTEQPELPGKPATSVLSVSPSAASALVQDGVASGEAPGGGAHVAAAADLSAASMPVSLPAGPVPVDASIRVGGVPGGTQDAPSLMSSSSLAALVPLAQPVRTMEDTVAELLRPLLREWLDKNMPRIVEKALKIEMASVAKPAPSSPKLPPN